MADLNVTRDDDTVPDAIRAAGVAPAVPITDAEHLLPAETHAAAPGVIAQVDDPDLARMQIEATRARMSDTIDQIEGALLRKKAAVEEKLDVMAPVRRTARQNPYPILGGVFAGALLLGWLTGRRDDDDRGVRPAVRELGMDQDVAARAAYGSHWEEQSRTWERRARRLMEVANRQEEELAALRGGEQARPRRGLFRRRREHVDVADAVGEGLAAGLTGLVNEEMSSTGYDGMPLHDADSYPPRSGGLGYGPSDPLPAPV